MLALVQEEKFPPILYLDQTIVIAITDRYLDTTALLEHLTDLSAYLQSSDICEVGLLEGSSENISNDKWLQVFSPCPSGRLTFRGFEINTFSRASEQLICEVAGWCLPLQQ